MSIELYERTWQFIGDEYLEEARDRLKLASISLPCATMPPLSRLIYAALSTSLGSGRSTSF